MLDIGFSEILLTSVIALVVLGPERLPKVVKQVGNWIGRARAMARQLGEQLDREVNAADINPAPKPAAKTARQMGSEPEPAHRLTSEPVAGVTAAEAIPSSAPASHQPAPTEIAEPPHSSNE